MDLSACLKVNVASLIDVQEANFLVYKVIPLEIGCRWHSLYLPLWGC
jgi:hypothetical protein